MVKFTGALDGFGYVSTFCNNEHDDQAWQDSHFLLCPPGNEGLYENSVLKDGGRGPPYE